MPGSTPSPISRCPHFPHWRRKFRYRSQSQASGRLTTRGGFGKHIWAAPVDGIEVYFLGLFIAEYLFTISICLVKSSILAFYWRIFGVMRSTRLFILVTTFQCLPVSAFWLRFNPNSSEMAYKCPVDVRMFFIANAIPNNITDILLLLIPIPGIWSLQLRTTQKIAVSGIFALGLFVTTVSFVRLYYVVELDFSSVDITWLFSEAMMWTTIELNVGTVCACLPSLRPILDLAMYGTAQHSTPRATGGNLSGITTIGGSRDPRKRDRGLRLNTPGDGACSSTPIAHSASMRQLHDDTHPLSALTDNESASWEELGSHDIEMDQIAKTGEGRGGRV
ncbi:Uncharacterized protein HZ326_28606 [Fusarium oxysporum f. sp. albedinis]|nr:Uncharacterized protein HZ326_28606 [Fusarium oxysporum f. sp. albedinis]